jgi:FkbM family methyltransferase
VSSGSTQPGRTASQRLARTLLENATHRFVVSRRLPPPFTQVRIYISSEGGLRYLRPNLDRVDPTLLRLTSEIIKPGQKIWDIGANLGLFSFAAAAVAGPGGHVLAVEPDTTLVRILRRTAASNRGHAPVEVLPAAIADDIAVGRFHVARRNRATSHLDGFGTTQTGGVRSTELVPTVTLDWLAANFDAPDVIKIDVEAAELKVLAGGFKILRKLPILICEVASCNADAVTEFLVPYGYTLYDGESASESRDPVATATPMTLAICTDVDRKGSPAHKGTVSR